ncbi:Probable ATP-dependent RNA helicase DDX60, partial [Lemmus lemmus]
MHEAEHDHLLKSLEKNLEIPQDCTYADQKAMDDKSLRMVFRRVENQRKGDTLKQLARRGIGFHHSSMSAREKQLVEILFRKGFIRVVTATGTLALGINMPCKSVVFAQNSVYLDALNFRQALSVLKHSLFSFKRPQGVTDMLKLYFLYSLQFLVKEGHIDQEGNPTGFAGLVSHLHYHEPSNLVFVSFLVRGLFHNLCQPTYE